MPPLLITRGEATATIHDLYDFLTRYDTSSSSSPDDTTTAETSSSTGGTATATATTITKGPTALTLITLILLVLIAAAILICSRATSDYGSYVDEVLRRRDEVTTRLLGGRNNIRGGRKKRKVSGPIDGEEVEMASLAAGSSASRDGEGVPWHGSNVLNTSWGWMG
ncbi:hypothetical protein K4F52_003432 [Lecanicillium sp. MT-2017a]|nr:hypothetical protein K4F52_003432 [Lecanicillium sp. MT-2017a]